MVYVGPERDHFGVEYADAFIEAVERGGGRVVDAPEEAEAIVWLGSEKAKLPGMLYPGVRWVQLPSAGVESWMEEGLIDTERIYTSAAGVYSETVAEHALALMLAGARRLHESARATSWEVGWGRSLAGSTVVILGAGGIGRALIRMLEPFGTRTLAVTRSGREVPGATRSYSADQTGELWPEGDFFVVAAPATGDTEKMIGARELDAMQSHAWVVNVARGSLIDTDALVEALAEGRIGGAALDVTDPEPLPDGHPLWTEPRALITPHTANPPDALARALAERIEENVSRFKAGEELIAVVDVEAGY
ncbi:MAG: hydroxyacid dehydrogenase [Acidobacteria bacterium]|nr:hydroxyacid dehydrogenase [Acidobacteriota bacterium]